MRLVPDLSEILGVLTPRERYVVKMRVPPTLRRKNGGLYPHSFQEIGLNLEEQISGERAKQIYDRAIRKLNDADFRKRSDDQRLAIEQRAREALARVAATFHRRTRRSQCDWFCDWFDGEPTSGKVKK